MIQNIVIAGSSGHAKVIIDIIECHSEYRIVGLVDDYRQYGEETQGYSILGEIESIPMLKKQYDLAGAVVAIGDNYSRSEVVARIKANCPELPFPFVIHPKSSIASNVSLGEGIVIMAGVSVNSCATVGDFCILNTNSSLDHDSVMENYSSLAPHVAIGGSCRIGGFSAVGIGAVIIQGITVGEHTVIGAGSTVLSDIKSYVTAYGTPTRIIKKRTAGSKYL